MRMRIMRFHYEVPIPSRGPVQGGVSGPRRLGIFIVSTSFVKVSGLRLLVLTLLAALEGQELVLTNLVS